MKAQRSVLGWREFVDLPGLGLDAVLAKMDTGARTSALHASKFEPFTAEDGAQWIRFKVSRTMSDHKRHSHLCEAPLLETRPIKSSNGDTEMRYVIRTALVIGTRTRMVEVTLTDRKNMRHAMLVGRSALRNRYIVDPGRTFLMGKQAVPQSSEQALAAKESET